MSAVRCVARKIKIAEEGERDGGIFISAGTVPRARRSIVVWMIVDRDAFWQWRPLSLSLCPRFIVTVMIIRLFADKLSFLATVWKNKFYRIFRICWVEIFWTRAKTKQISEILRIRKEGIRFISNRYPINLVVPWKKSVEGREKKYNRNIRLETCDIFSLGTTNIPKGKQKLSKQTFPIFPTYS